MKDYLIEKRLKEMCSNGHLTNEQNNFLLQEYYEDLKKGISPEDSQAYALLIMGNEKLLLHTIKTKFGTKSMFDEDMVSVGRIALIKAIDTFKTERNTEFSSYATGCIKYAIMNYNRDMRNKRLMPDQQIFLDDYVKDCDSDEDITLLDTLSDDEDIVKSIQDNCFFDTIKKNINYLRQEEALALILYCGLFDYPKLSIAKISEKLNLSRPTIYKSVEDGFKKLKVLITEDKNLTTRELVLKQKLLKHGFSNYFVLDNKIGYMNK